MSAVHENLCRELYGLRPGTAKVPDEQGGFSGRYLLRDHRGVGLVRFHVREHARQFGIWLFVNGHTPNWIEDTGPA